MPAAFIDDAVALVLRRDRRRWRVAAIRIGVGPGLAVALENVAAG